MIKLIGRFVTFLIFVFVGSVAMSQLWAQPKQLVPKEQKRILEKADIAYKGFKYVLAADYYEKYLSSMPDSSNALLTKLADCYWQTRQYNDAFRVYKNLYKEDVNQKATAQQKLRVGELCARFHDYKQASQWLSGIDGYQSKVAAFRDTLKLKSMKKDSLNWQLDFLNINTPYQEFSPAIVDDVLYFSSNRPDAVLAKFDKGEFASYDRLWKISKSETNTNPLKVQNSISKEKPNVSGTAEGKGASLFKELEKLQYNIGTVSIDKNNHYYFTANYRNSDRKGVNRLRLIEVSFNRSGSLKMKALPFGDPKSFSVMHLGINMDGTFLVLSSDKPNGKGNNDLYYTQRKSILQSWDSLKAFGNNINTVGNEVFSSITSDGYLYFSSDARPGLGGLDIYRIPLKDAILGDGEPEHLSYPINSSADDFGWTQDNTGMTGFFSSDRLNNDDNLYRFRYKDRQRIDYTSGSTADLQTQKPDKASHVSGNIPGIRTQEPDKIRYVSGSTLDLQTHESSKIRYVSGKIVELKTNKPIAGATVFLRNKRTNKVTIAKTNIDGEYHFNVASTDKVILKAVKNGMTNDCLEDNLFDIQLQEDTVMKKVRDLLLEKQTENDHIDVELNDESQPADTISNVMQNLISKKHSLKINDRWKLNNIHYNFDKWDIRADATPILDSLITLLRMYPIRVELGSHTDSRGTFEYNDWLSQKRAESVVAYLVEHGIESNRVNAKGYGKRFLLNHCADGVPCSEREHQVNRRTEVKVISNSDIQKYQKDNIDMNQFSDGEQINKSALHVDFFDNYDKSNSSKETYSSLKKNQSPDLNSKYKFPIRYSPSGFNTESQYHYILNELVHVISENPSIILQITAQDDANDRSEILSDLRANMIREYLINKGVSANKCQIDKSKKTKSEVSYGNAVLHVDKVNLDNLLLHNFIQFYKGDSKEMIIRNDNGKYCVQLGAFRTRERSQQLADKIQSIISVPVSVIEEGDYFKIRTPYGTNKNDTIEIAAIIQASGVLYGK